MEQNQSETPIPVKKSLPFKNIAISIVLMLIASGTTFFLMTNKKVEDSAIEDKTNTEPTTGSIFEKTEPIENWEPLTSNTKAFPYVDRDTRNLSLWRVDDKKLHDTGLKVLWGGGEAGKGNVEPLVSPDSLFTVFGAQEDKSLWLLSHETQEKKKISPDGVEVNLITDWTSDGKYIIYHVKEESFIFDGMGRYEGIVKFREQEYSGFLAFNTITGKTIKLSPVTYVETAIDDTKLLVRTVYNGEQLITFDIETFEADFDILSDIYPFGVSQFEFSKDGSNWTYTYSKNPTDDANIAYGKFPSKKDEMKLLDSGVWAEVQWPKISPDGTKLMYQKKNGMQSAGLPKHKTIVIDLNTMEEITSVEGGSAEWIDNNYIAVGRTLRDGYPTSDRIIINLDNKEEFLIGPAY